MNLLKRFLRWASNADERQRQHALEAAALKAIAPLYPEQQVEFDHGGRTYVVGFRAKVWIAQPEAKQ